MEHYSIRYYSVTLLKSALQFVWDSKLKIYDLGFDLGLASLDLGLECKYLRVT